MTITVLPIIDPDTTKNRPLAQVMKERLRRLANELVEIHLKPMEVLEPLFEDVVIYIGYNSNYAVQWKIVNDAPHGTEALVAKQCDKLGYIKWKTATINTFNGNR